MTALAPGNDWLELRSAERWRIPLPKQANEREFADKVLSCLESWFKVEREVRGRHAFGRMLRVDAVASPLDPSGWRDPDPAFAIEFKDAPEGTNHRMRHAAQAVDYTYVDWNGYGRLGVFLCTPGVGVFPQTEGDRDSNFYLARLAGQFTVGELCYTKYFGWTLMIHGQHILWRERYWEESSGPHEARHRTIKPKVGSR